MIVLVRQSIPKTDLKRAARWSTPWPLWLHTAGLSWTRFLLQVTLMTSKPDASPTAERAQVIEEETFQPVALTGQHLVTGLRRFATFSELRRSQFYEAHKPEIVRLLNEPRVYRFDDVRPRLRSFLRVVEWNIERGSRLAGIIEVLNNHPVLKFADLMLINELDEGMFRSGNINVA